MSYFQERGAVEKRVYLFYIHFNKVVIVLYLTKINNNFYKYNSSQPFLHEREGVFFAIRFVVVHLHYVNYICNTIYCAIIFLLRAKQND